MQIKAFFDEKAENWDSIKRNNPETINAILTITGLKENQKVLDIACGTGILFPFILKKSPKEYHAIDLSDKMIEKAKSKAISQTIRLQAIDIMDYTESNFDYAILFNAYPHFLDPEAVARKVSQIVKAGGRFVIAHDHSRHTINHRHQGQDKLHLSRSLENVQTETKPFAPYFDMDILVDSDDLFILSGIRKA